MVFDLLSKYISKIIINHIDQKRHNRDFTTTSILAVHVLVFFIVGYLFFRLSVAFWNLEHAYEYFSMLLLYLACAVPVNIIAIGKNLQD